MSLLSRSVQYQWCSTWFCLFIMEHGINRTTAGCRSDCSCWLKNWNVITCDFMENRPASFTFFLFFFQQLKQNDPRVLLPAATQQGSDVQCLKNFVFYNFWNVSWPQGLSSKVSEIGFNKLSEIKYNIILCEASSCSGPAGWQHFTLCEVCGVNTYLKIDRAIILALLSVNPQSC